MRLALCLVLLSALPAHAWTDVTGERDMPWLGDGARARYYARQTWCVMCTTGSRHEEQWGSRWRGEEPYTTVRRAFGFLDREGVLATWPEAEGAGSVSDGTRTIEPRAAPWVFTVVMLRPTVVVMRFDLGALARVVPTPEHYLLTPFLDHPIEYGTRVPSTGSLLWFSPDTKQTPTPVNREGPGRASIQAGDTRLVLTLRDDVWVVEPER